METVGDTSEDPFENFHQRRSNDDACVAQLKSILRQMLGETDLPEPIGPVNDILM